jgi:hypothetical protein
LIALTAGNERIDGHELARSEVSDFGTDCEDGPGAFVPDDPGELDELRPDASGAEVVEVGAADPHGFNAKQDVTRVFEPGFGHFSDLQLPEASQECSLHGNSSARV